MNSFIKNNNGYYGQYGGCFIPEILHSTIDQLKNVFYDCKKDPNFYNEYKEILQHYSCRPTPISYLKNLSEELGGAKIFAKREDLNQTGSHKLNNVIGQGLLTKKLGKKEILAETGAGQHGFAAATMAAKMGFKSTIFMGATDVKRQRPNVFWMENLGSKVIPVKDGQQTLKDAINEALRYWVTHSQTTNYVFGTACGPHPFPEMVFYFQSIISQEAKQQFKKMTGTLPNRIFACVGGGSNALGIFANFIQDKNIQLVACEAGGRGQQLGNHASRLSLNDASIGIAHGYKSMFLQDINGNMQDTHSISAGLDYVGISPILAHLHEIERIRAESVLDTDVINAVDFIMKKEGIIPALESSHAIAQAIKEAPKMNKDETILINISGRGDKDIFNFAEALKDEKWYNFIKEKAQSYKK